MPSIRILGNGNPRSPLSRFLEIMLYKVGRFLQLVGLVVLPFAISGNVAEKLDLKTSLVMSGVGMVIFLIGWMVQQGAKAS